MIGAVAVFGRTPNLNRLTGDEWWRAGAAGFDIAATGTEAIADFLADLQRTYPYHRRSKEGPQALFGRLYQWLAFGADDLAYEPLRALLADYITDHLPLGPGDTVFGRPVTVRKLHSVRTLSKETGLHPKRLRKILGAAGVLGGDEKGFTHSRAIFPVQEARPVLRRGLGDLSVQAAGRHLNAPRVQIELLARRGFIKPAIPGRAFSAADRYTLAELDGFLARLFAGATPVRKPKPTQVDLPTAAKRACCSAADILHLILNRKLTWVGRLAGERGYLAVLVDLDEIKRLTRGPDHGGLTQAQVKDSLKTTDRVVHALVKEKLLATFVARDPVNHCPAVLFRPESLANFRREYVSLFMLAKERKKHLRKVLKELDAQGIEPAFDPKKIGARIYRRGNLTDQ